MSNHFLFSLLLTIEIMLNNFEISLFEKEFLLDYLKQNYIFLSNDEIEKMEIQKLPLNFSSKKLAIYFENTGDRSTPWTLPKKHKLVSYQQENYNKLANKLL